MNENSILIVDDEIINRKVLIYALQRFNYHFFEAENGLQAIEIIKNHLVHLIILDLMMPEMDGFQFMEWIKLHTEYQNIPIIVNSALSDNQYIQKSLTFGSYDYFTKPIKSDVLHLQLPLKVKNALNFYQLLNEVMENRNKLLLQNEYLSKELNLASELQRTLMPQRLPECAKIELAHVYQPSTQLGGDFYDIELEKNLYQLIIADVSGHGTPAALLTSALKSYFNTFIEDYPTPPEFLQHISQNLYHLMKNTDFYVSGLFAQIDLTTFTMTFSNAGHHTPIIYHWRNNSFESIPAPSFFLGIAEDTIYDSYQVQLESNDILVFFTDGIIEARNAQRKEFGIDQLKHVIAKNAHAHPKIILTSILNQLSIFLNHQNQPNDDITIICLKLN